jgi:ABC-type transporter Mla subunit MlaD
MRFARILLAALTVVGCYAQQFTFTGRGHTYKVTVSSASFSGLGFGGPLAV